MRIRDNWWTQKITYWQALPKRKTGGEERNWADDITNFLQNKFIHQMALDRLEWSRLREALAQKQGQIW